MTPNQLLAALSKTADQYPAGEDCFRFSNVGVQSSDIYDLCQYVKHLEATSRELERIKRTLIIDRYQEP